MESLFGKLGPVGLALVLTVFLLFGTKPKPGSKAKALGWGTTLFLALIAGAAYKAAGPPFDVVSEIANDLMRQAGTAFPGLMVSAMALILGILIYYGAMSLRMLSLAGILLFYVASSAGGLWGIAAQKIELIALGLAG